jgi:hypothetical protein
VYRNFVRGGPIIKESTMYMILGARARFYYQPFR